MGTVRERRSDAVAKSMGEFLLKGYRMLATSCETCNNVLLQDRDGLTLCINCQEPVKDEEDQILSRSDTSKAKGDSFDSEKSSPGTTDAAEILLMMEITSAMRYLEALPPGTDLQHKQIYIRHIRECAETIKALRSIK